MSKDHGSRIENHESRIQDLGSRIKDQESNVKVLGTLLRKKIISMGMVN